MPTADFWDENYLLMLAHGQPMFATVIASLAAHGQDRRPNAAHDRADMTGRIIPGDGRLDGTTASVAQHHDKSRAEMLDRVFNAAQLIVPHDFPSRADDEKVTNVLIENDLGRRARIGTADDDGEGMLRAGGGHAAGARGLPAARRGGDKTGVAGLEFRQRRVGSHGGGGMISGQDQTGSTKQNQRSQ